MLEIEEDYDPPLMEDGMSDVSSFNTSHYSIKAQYDVGTGKEAI